MSFEEALRALRSGKHVRRKAWSYSQKITRGQIINLEITLSWDDLNSDDWEETSR